MKHFRINIPTCLLLGIVTIAGGCATPFGQRAAPKLADGPTTLLPDPNAGSIALAASFQTENVDANPVVTEATNFALADPNTSPASPQKPRPHEWLDQYIIETGDSLEFKFRIVKELNDIVTVRPDGLISLQLVGEMQAAGLTAEQLRRNLIEAYSVELNNPDIAVIVRSFSGNSIYVGGEVYSAGRIPLTGRITTLRAIILAGGFKDTADQECVRVRRANGSCCEYNLRSVVECTSRNQDIFLEPNDVIYVPKSHIAKVNLFVEQYIEKVLPFSRSFGVFVSHNTGIPAATSGP